MFDKIFDEIISVMYLKTKQKHNIESPGIW